MQRQLTTRGKAAPATTKTARTALIAFAGAAMLSLAASSFAQQDWPNKPVRIIGAGAAGGTVDLFIRIFGEPLQKKYGQPFIADNRPGGGGRIATEAIAKAPPDGYLLGTVGGAQTVVGPLLVKTVPFHPVNDFRFIARFVTLPNILYAGKGAPFHSVKDMIAWGKANPGKINYGTLGIGTTTHLTAVAFERATGISMTHIPYPSANRLVEAALGNVIHVAFDNVGPGSIGQVRSGAVTGIAVTGKGRWPALPDLPSVEESGVPNFDFSTWYAFAGPAGMPPAIADKFAADIRDIMRMPDIQEKLRQAGGEPSYLGSDDLKKFVESEIAKWAPVVKSANVSLD